MPSALIRLVLEHARTLRLLALVLAALLVFSMQVMAPGLFASLEEGSSDPVWSFAAARADGDERRVVIVDIDEKSLGHVGAWPWSREQVASLSDALLRHGAAVQLMDIVFPESREGDAALIEAQQRGGLHVAQLFAFEPDAGRVGTLSGALQGVPCHGLFPVAGGYVGNAPGLATGAGHITPVVDRDGIVRRMAPVICHQQASYPALALLALPALAGSDKAPRVVAGHDAWGPAGWLEYVELGKRIPFDADGTTRLGFGVSPEAFTAVSAADVLEDRIPSGMLDGAVALVGATAFGLGDKVSTPLSVLAPGVEVHARVIADLLDDRLPFTPRIAGSMQWMLVLLFGMVLAAIAQRQRRLHAYALPIAGVSLAATAYLAHAALLLMTGRWFGWMAPALFALSGAALLAVAEFSLARRERTRLYNHLSSYLPRKVAEQVALREPIGTVDAERREVTVLFADLRNASAYFESRPPEEVGALLHAFFTTAHRVISEEGGVVEEFVGDSVMAVWDDADQAVHNGPRALRAAHSLVREVGQLLPEPAPPGLEPLAVGVGLESGSALVGSFGAIDRRTHAVLGETVTVAVRAQAMTLELATPVVLGPGAASNLPEGVVRSAGTFLLEGLQRPRELFVPAQAVSANAEDNADTRIRLVR